MLHSTTEQQHIALHVRYVRAYGPLLRRGRSKISEQNEENANKNKQIEQNEEQMSEQKATLKQKQRT